MKKVATACLLASLAGLAMPALADDAVGGIVQGENDVRWVAGEVIVRFAHQPTADDLAAIEAVVGSRATWREIPHAPHYKGDPDRAHPLSYVRVVEFDDALDVQALARAIGDLDGVNWTSANNVPEPTLIPDDPRYGQQWAPERIHAEDGWDIELGTHDVIVASIDTGCVLDHEDLEDNVWVNTGEIAGNGIDDDGNGFVDDTHGWNFQDNNNDLRDVFGHGTQVAGIMSAGVNNAIGIAGMANTRVMNPKWWHFSGSDASVAGCIYYAVDNGARALNMSLSGGGGLPLTEDACNYAEDNNVLSVAAAGNHGGSNPQFPSGYDNVMAISGININNQKPGFSGWGSHIDVAGPTEGILSTGPGGRTSYDPGFSGTSAASPHVCGVAGLVFSVNPDLTAVEVREIINTTAEDVGDPGFDLFFGNGRVHHAAAAEAALSGCPADLDGDGDVDADDFFEYLDAFANGDLDVCSMDGDGDCDAQDFFLYLDLFVQGC